MMLAGREAADTATEAREFGYGGHLLVWSWRRIASGRAHCPVMARQFARACGEDAAEVLLTFHTFLKALAFAARRQLAIGAPCALAITPDERRILTLIAAAQAEMPGLFEAHLRALARPERRHVLQLAAGALATALLVNELRLGR
jgi:hypothetical protein